MPMDRKRYPEDWDAIALAVKEAAGWSCQGCDRPCLRPGEDWLEFQKRIGFRPKKLRQHVLTVAHLDHVPENCAEGNLKALCTVCHCRYDLSQMGRKRMLRLEHLGQLRLFAELPTPYSLLP